MRIRAPLNGRSEWIATSWSRPSAGSGRHSRSWPAHAGTYSSGSRRILHDVDLAEDAVQQALVTAWRDLPGLRDPDRFDAWLQRVLVNACFAESRRKRAWTANIRALPIDGPAGPDELRSLADRDEIERGFRRMPPDQRAILVLHHYLGLGLSEIGEVLDIPPGTARSRLHYAHRAMRAVLEADGRPAVAAGGRIS
jgi:RNA polymerase sigma-70 factor, ECF subfamily